MIIFKALFFCQVKSKVNLALILLLWYILRRMRIDKFFKLSRLLKRRAVACEACSEGKVSVNGRAVKPAYNVKIGDVVTISLKSGDVVFVVKSLNEKVSAKEASTLYEIIG